MNETWTTKYCTVAYTNTMRNLSIPWNWNWCAALFSTVCDQGKTIGGSQGDKRHRHQSDEKRTPMAELCIKWKLAPICLQYDWFVFGKVNSTGFEIVTNWMQALQIIICISITLLYFELFLFNFNYPIKMHYE